MYTCWGLTSNSQRRYLVALERGDLHPKFSQAQHSRYEAALRGSCNAAWQDAQARLRLHIDDTSIFSHTGQTKAQPHTTGTGSNLKLNDGCTQRLTIQTLNLAIITSLHTAKLMC